VPADISIIIPFLNESPNIPRLIQELNEFCNKNNDKVFELIFVDDGSTDNSKELFKTLEVKVRSRVISFSKNFGAHAALRAGIKHATGNYITFMYADLQDPLDLVNRMYEVCSKEDKDICWASRENFATGMFHRLFSKMYASLIRKYVSRNFPESGFDIVMFNRKVQGVMNANIENNSSVFLQILTMGFSSQSITYLKTPRKAGKSKWTFSKKIKLLIDSFVGFSYMPIRLVSIIGISFFIVGIIWSGYIVIRKVFWGDLSAGWPMLSSILLLGFGITNIALGVIAEYLWRTLDASRKRPVFIIDEILELDGNV
jgi:glycosyltransferase involved in cell wall biosynthesis